MSTSDARHSVAGKDEARVEPETAAAQALEELTVVAKQALVQLGFPAAIANEAVRAAHAYVGTEVSLEAFIKEALRNSR